MKLSSFTIILSFILLVILGVVLLPMLPVKLNPSHTLPSVHVHYFWRGANSRNIEQHVTSLLEGAFSRIQGLKKISSVSSNDQGLVTLDFDDKVNLDAIRLEMATILREIYPKFPSQVSYPQIEISHSKEETNQQLLSYTLYAPMNHFLIQKYANDNIRPILASIKGVQEVNVYGSSPMEWVISYDVDMLRTLDISINDIQTAISRCFFVGNAGMGYEIQNSDTTVKHLTFRNYQTENINLPDLPIKCIGNRTIYLKDITTLRHQEQAPISYFRINGDNTVNIIIYADAFESQLKVSQKIKRHIQEIEKNLPSGYTLLKSYDATEFIKQELMKNVWRAIFTIIILLGFVLLATGSWRYLLLIFISIVADLCIAVIFYYIFRLELHLYSLAGITISLSLIKNNSIVMIDHLRHKGNLKVFLAVLSATLTSIASLIVVFFLDDQLKLVIFDFSIIIIINLAISLVVALFLIPALMDKISIKKRFLQKRKQFILWGPKTRFYSSFPIYFSNVYGQIIKFLCRLKWLSILIVLFGFGVPIYKLPDKLEKNNWFAIIYNNTFGSPWYKENAKSVVDKILGGALRKFELETYQRAYFGGVQKTALYLSVKMNYGSSLDQTNELVKSIENYLKQFIEIDQFQSDINTGYAFITIYFKKEFEKSVFPFKLKQMLTQKAIEQGGADWNVYGFGGGFSNEIRSSLGNRHITIYGYNYDKLYELARQVRNELIQSSRVKEVKILSKDTWNDELPSELVLELNQEKLTTRGLSPFEIYSSLGGYTKEDIFVGSIITNGNFEQIRVESKQYKEYDLWQLKHIQRKMGHTEECLENIANLKKESSPLDIVKENQQYILLLKYDFIGTDVMSDAYQEEILEKTEKMIPLGYTIKGDTGWWHNNIDKKQYWWLVLIIVIIFFICSILFESLLLPLAVILMIPISYIGLFLTFILFRLNFDQGGFAAMILLSGVTVNSALYIINDFNNLRKKEEKNTSSVRLYVKAYNQKIFPIMLTILSTTLGLAPFLSGGSREIFWPALAAGTIGGLLFSIIGIFFFLPLVLIRKKVK